MILFVGSLLIGFCLSYYESLWLPLFAPLLGVILAGIYAEFAGRGSGESEESEELNMEEEELNPVPPPSTYKRKKEEKQEIHPTAEVEEDIAAQEGNEEGVSAEGDSSEEMEEPLTLDEAIIQPPSLKPPGKTRTTQKLRRMKKSQTKHKGREK